MPYIRTVPIAQATGLLKTEYERAIRRAGRVFNVVGIQSLNAPVLSASLRLYQTLMLAPFTSEIADMFTDGESAVFYRSTSELIDKCRYYVAHPKEREAIARRGRERCIRDGRDHRSTIRPIAAMLEQLLWKCKGAA